jgi:hypothetical protein
MRFVWLKKVILNVDTVTSLFEKNATPQWAKCQTSLIKELEFGVMEYFIANSRLTLELGNNVTIKLCS